VEDNPFEDNGSAGGTDPPEQEAHQHEQVIDAVSFDRSEGKNDDCDSGSQAEDNPLNFQEVDEFLFYSEEEQQESDGLDDKPDNNGFGDGLQSKARVEMFLQALTEEDQWTRSPWRSETMPMTPPSSAAPTTTTKATNLMTT